MKNIRFTKRF